MFQPSSNDAALFDVQGADGVAEKCPRGPELSPDSVTVVRNGPLPDAAIDALVDLAFAIVSREPEPLLKVIGPAEPTDHAIGAMADFLVALIDKKDAVSKVDPAQ